MVFFQYFQKALKLTKTYQLNCYLCYFFEKHMIFFSTPKHTKNPHPNSPNKLLIILIVFGSMIPAFLLTQNYLKQRNIGKTPLEKGIEFENMESLQAIDNFDENQNQNQNQKEKILLSKKKESKQTIIKEKNNRSTPDINLKNTPTKKFPNNKPTDKTNQKKESKFKSILEAKNNTADIVSIGPLWFVREELNSCIKKCSLKVKDQNLSTITLVFFKSAFYKQFEDLSNKVMIEGRLNPSKDQVFLSKIHKVE